MEANLSELAIERALGNFLELINILDQVTSESGAQQAVRDQLFERGASGELTPVS